MYLAQYLRKNTITRVPGPGLSPRKKNKKETKGKDGRRYIKHITKIHVSQKGSQKYFQKKGEK